MNAKNNSAARFMMLYHADLVSAIRLPNNLFTENANTEVGSDLIILQKNSQKESLRGDDNLLDTVYNDENRIPTNNYYLEHPERIIHTTAKLDTDPFGKPAMIYTHEDGVEGIAEKLRKMLNEDFGRNFHLSRYLGEEQTTSWNEVERWSGQPEQVQSEQGLTKLEQSEQGAEQGQIEHEHSEPASATGHNTLWNKVERGQEQSQSGQTKLGHSKPEQPEPGLEQGQSKPGQSESVPPTGQSHQQPPVQMTLFDLWGMEEDNRLKGHATKKKTVASVGAAATGSAATKKMPKKKASPLVKNVNPTFEVGTKPVEKEEKPSLAEAKGHETAQKRKTVTRDEVELEHKTAPRDSVELEQIMAKGNETVQMHETKQEHMMVKGHEVAPGYETTQGDKTAQEMKPILPGDEP